MRRTFALLASSLVFILLATACAQPVAQPTASPAASRAPSVQPTAAPEPQPDPKPVMTAAPPAMGTAAAGVVTSDLAGDLVIYSARKESLMEPLLAAFTARYPKLSVSIKSGAPGELGLLIEQEKSSPRGDVFFTTDAAAMEGLHQKGLLESYRSPNATRVPDEFKAADGAWTGVIGRSRNFVINTTLLTQKEAPQSIFELTDPKWKGKLAMASIREGGVRLWLAWLLQDQGEAATQKYVDGLLANDIKVLANHTEVMNAVARGEVAVGLVNHYYYVPKAREGAPVALIYPDQGPDQVGTLVIPLAVGILEGARHQEAAKAFVDFALSPEGLQPLTTQEQEFPLVPGVGLGAAAAPGVRSIDEFNRPTLDFTKLTDFQKRAVELFTAQLSGGS